VRAPGPRLALAALVAFLCFPAWPAAASAGIKPWTVQVVQTSDDLTQRLARLADLSFGAGRAAPGDRVIDVNDRVRYQSVTGFGAAMTDSSAWLLQARLSPSTRASLIAKLFGAGGIHLNFLRLPMGASDFTRTGMPYSYDDMPPGRSDPLLSHFSVAHDLAYIVPALRQVLAVNPRLQIVANPWSPPAWMKTNGSLSNQDNRGVLLSSAYWPWAQYFVKFLRAFAHLGVPISAITPQNEPTNATMYPGLNLDSSSEARFLTRYLAPALHGAGLHPKIFGHDYGWSDKSTAYAQAIATGPAAGVLSGIAWHCYFGSPGVMSTLHRRAPKLVEIVDECSPGITPFSISELVISGLRNWAGVIALWNLALDPHGGPVQPPNHGCPTCSGVVTVDQLSHQVRYTRSFFQLAQGSQFVQPGAERIASDHFVEYRYLGAGADVVSSGLDDVALLNPDGSRVLIAYDNSPRPIRFTVRWRGRSFTYTLAPKATTTFIWNRPA
jgi:glucosylceramidase